MTEFREGDTVRIKDEFVLETGNMTGHLFLKEFSSYAGNLNLELVKRKEVELARGQGWYRPDLGWKAYILEILDGEVFYRYKVRGSSSWGVNSRSIERFREDYTVLRTGIDND